MRGATDVHRTPEYREKMKVVNGQNAARRRAEKAAAVLHPKEETECKRLAKKNVLSDLRMLATAARRRAWTNVTVLGAKRYRSIAKFERELLLKLAVHLKGIEGF